MLRAKTSHKKAALPRRFHVKKGDTVILLAGKDKGKTGVIKHVLRSKGKVIVEGLNLVKKAVRPNPMLGQDGGLIQMEAAIFVSNVMLYDTKNSKPSRAKIVVVDGKPVRVSKKTGEHFDV